MRWANPKPHERIAVVGIGGLGHLALQYSKAAGFETIAITHSKDKEELVHKLGADIVVSDGQGLREMQVLRSVKKECTLRMKSMDRRFAHAILITNELPEQVACRTEMKITNRRIK